LEALRENPANSDLMIASAVARIDGAVPILEAQYELAPPNDIRKLAAAAALAAFEVDQSAHVQWLLEQLSSPGPSETWRSHIVAALGVAGSSDVEAALLGIVSEYATTGSVLGVSGSVASDIAIRAAKGLGVRRTPTAFSAVQDLVRKLGPIRPGPGDRRHGELAWLLLGIDEVAGTSAIRTELGEEWLQHLLAVRALKRLPSGLVPRRSADVDVDGNIFWFI
jgi:hypothetical protein